MAFMDYLPSLPKLGEEAPPTDDATAQLLLKRKLALADSLRNQEMPQGQMVSGHYVAPSWTQYLGNLANKWVSGQQEREAIKGYQDYQKTQNQKLGSLLEDLSKGKETKTVDNTPFQIQIPGESTPTSPWTSEQGPSKTINVPMTNTTSTYTPYTQKEFMAKVGAVMPEMLPKFLESTFAQYAPKKPIEISAGGMLVDPDTHKILVKNPKETAESTSPLEKEYDFMVRYGYKGSPQDYFDMKRSMTDKERQDLDIKLKQLGIDQLNLYYNTGYGNPPGAGNDVNAAALAWANANPNDPRAAKIKNKLGVK